MNTIIILHRKMKLAHLLCVVLLCAFIRAEKFHEELMIKPCGDGYLYTYFRFTTLLDYESWKDSRLLSEALKEVSLVDGGITDLRLSLTAGLWRHKQWGYPVVEAAPGSEMLVTFMPHMSESQVNERWKQVTTAFSGLVCASLNFIDETNTLSPNVTFRGGPGVTRYATLPREIVCTENLTPWKKLLPCKSKKGLSTLLNGKYIHNTNYHSIAIHLQRTCRDVSCELCDLKLVMSVSLVYNLPITVDNWRPVTDNWSFGVLFGTAMLEKCPLASTSSIYVDVTDNQAQDENLVKLNFAADNVTVSERAGHSTRWAVYNLTKGEKSFNLISTRRKPDPRKVNPPRFHVHRYLTGVGREAGGISTIITNDYREPLSVTVLENIPWFISVYFYTLKIVDGAGKPIKPDYLHYFPGKARARPYFLEMTFEVPAKNSARISLQFEYAFLKWQEYPPDANHGFYIPPSVVTAYLPYSRYYTALPPNAATIPESWNATSLRGYKVELRSEPLIVSLPTPDFSMPYNVICLACTVVALAFGPIHNITTKRLCLTTGKVRQTYLGEAIDLVKDRFVKICGSFKKSPKAEEQQDTIFNDGNSSYPMMVISASSLLWYLHVLSHYNL